MELRRISKEAAQAAKAKGYDIFEDYGYRGYGRNVVPFNIGVKDRYSIKDEYYAPLQAKLQKWLMEKCELVVLARPMRQRENKWSYGIYPLGTSKDISNSDFKVDYDCYDDALEQGMIEALRMIRN